MHIRPAPPTRAWMDATPERYGYRCLPLSIANTHGWEICTPAGFWVMWTGDESSAGVQIRTDRDMPPGHAPVSIFGARTVTIHTHGIFRTPPGWSLMVTGPLNTAKDGITALTGIIETDWAPMTFTMNWRLTRPGHWVRFDAGEAIAHLMPVQRGMIEQWEPELVSMRENPDLLDQFTRWSASRDAFHAQIARRPTSKSADAWQKDYFRGLDMNGNEAPGHQTKLRLCPFSAVKR
jgi:Family of unknown function (DUF6065)